MQNLQENRPILNAAAVVDPPLTVRRAASRSGPSKTAFVAQSDAVANLIIGILPTADVRIAASVTAASALVASAPTGGLVFLLEHDGQRHEYAPVAAALRDRASDAHHVTAEWSALASQADEVEAKRALRDPIVFARPPKPEEPLPLIGPVPAPDPYPLAGLGADLEGVACAVESVVQSPAAMCANSVLAVVTLAAQPHINVEL